MGKKLRIVLAVSVMAILGGIVSLVTAPPEPAYGGKPLSVWLAEYDHQRLSWPRTFNTPADEAVRHIGTNAFPMLTRRLLYRDSALKVSLSKFLQGHQLHLPFPITTQNRYNAQAVAALCALGREAKPLIPTLADALDHMDLSARLSAGFWLESEGSDSEAAIPALIRVLRDKNNKMRFFAVETLAAVGVGQRKLVLPVLQECLQDPDASVRLQATNEFSREPWRELMNQPGPTLTNRMPPTQARME